MTAFRSTVNGVGKAGRRASTESGCAIARAWSLTCALLALLALLFAGQAGAGQQHAAKTPSDFEQAEALLQQGHLEEAKAALLEKLKQGPASVEGLNLLGIIESGLREYSDALAAFDKALQLNPKSTKTHNNLGNFFAAEQKPELAEKEFRAVLGLDPANQDANYNLGVLLMAKGAPAEAIPHLQRVHAANIANGLRLVSAYFQCKRAADGLRLAAQLSAQAKSDVKVHFSLGVLLASEKQYKPAQLELEKAVALEPGTFEILLNLGQVLLRNGENAKAELALSRAATLKPDSPEALYLLAQVYVNQSRPLDALDCLVRAHKIAPQSPDIDFLIAQVSMSQNFFEDAIPLLQSGLEAAPLRTDLRAALGESYFMAGKIDKAIEEFTKLVEAEHSARSYAFLGLAYRDLGRFDEAKGYLEQGLKLDPHNSACLFNLGFIAERQGDAATAEARFLEALRGNPDFADALLELANLRIAAGKLAEAEELLRRFVRVSHDPATGYYKLAKVERSLHETAAADRDLSVFQSLSKNASTGPYPYQHLFDYLDNRLKLAPGARDQLDIADLNDEIKRHPDQPNDLYMLAEAYLKAGNAEEARSTVAALDKISAGDYRTLTGVGVLLARYRFLDDAIQHFQAALQANPGSDEVKFDLANAYFRKRSYSQALETAGQVSEAGRKDDAYLALLGDIYAHLGDNTHAAEIFQDAIGRNPDDDLSYLALSLLQFRENNVAGAKQTLLKGQARIPGSGKLLWGLGIASALEGDSAKAESELERAVDLLPEWPGGYSILGVFYFQTGQIAKAKEVLNRFKNSSAAGSLDASRIEQLLARAPSASPAGNEPLTPAGRSQLLQLALSLADRTL